MQDGKLVNNRPTLEPIKRPDDRFAHSHPSNDKSFYGETGVCTLWMRSKTRNEGFPMDQTFHGETGVWYGMV